MQMETVEDSQTSEPTPSSEPVAPKYKELKTESMSAPPLLDLFQYQPQASQAEQMPVGSLEMTCLVAVSQQTQLPPIQSLHMQEAPFDMTSLLAASQQIQMPSAQHVFQQAVQTPLPAMPSMHSVQPQSKTSNDCCCILMGIVFRSTRTCTCTSSSSASAADGHWASTTREIGSEPIGRTIENDGWWSHTRATDGASNRATTLSLHHRSVTRWTFCRSAGAIRHGARATTSCPCQLAGTTVKILYPPERSSTERDTCRRIDAFEAMEQ